VQVKGRECSAFEQVKDRGEILGLAARQATGGRKDRDPVTRDPQREEAAIIRSRRPWQEATGPAQKHATPFLVATQARMAATFREQAFHRRPVIGKHAVHRIPKGNGIGLQGEGSPVEADMFLDAEPLDGGNRKAQILVSRREDAAGRALLGTPAAHPGLTKAPSRA